jgi:hypothetical protein
MIANRTTLALVAVALMLNAPHTRAAAAPREFRDAKLTVADGDKSKEVDVTLRFDTENVQFVNAKSREALRTFAYGDCKSAEYSYSKSPRWKTGLLVSPFLFLSQGKKHWFMVKTANDYALLHLDKDNYKLILAEFETRTGLKVAAEGENK